VTWTAVKEAFETAFDAPGCIEKVDLVSREDDQGRSFKKVFVHFNNWPDSDNATRAMAAMTSGDGKGSFNLVYDEPWYWKCSISRVVAPTNRNNNTRTGVRRAPYVAIGEPRTPARRDQPPAPDVVCSLQTADDGESSDDGEVDEDEFADKTLEDSIGRI